MNVTLIFHNTTPPGSRRYGDLTCDYSLTISAGLPRGARATARHKET